MNDIIIEFSNGGTAQFVLDESTRPLAALGHATIERASHVVPVSPVLRVVFRALRRFFGDDGKAAAFTRGWRCSWYADMVGGERLGPYATRQEALAAERDWIREHRGL
jgi:hypothetical protein